MSADALGYTLFLAALVLMITASRFQRPALSIMASFSWIILGVFAYGLSAGTWDIYYGIFWLGIAMAVISALETIGIVRSKREAKEAAEAENEVEDKTGWDRYAEDIERRRGRIDKIRSLRRTRR